LQRSSSKLLAEDEVGLGRCVTWGTEAGASAADLSAGLTGTLPEVQGTAFDIDGAVIGMAGLDADDGCDEVDCPLVASACVVVLSAVYRIVGRLSGVFTEPRGICASLAGLEGCTSWVC
jgi:hypothetical protein